MTGTILLFIGIALSAFTRFGFVLVTPYLTAAAVVVAILCHTVYWTALQTSTNKMNGSDEYLREKKREKAMSASEVVAPPS